ncbi:unnamed protein product [Peronospora belbahrii]|uniref:CUE domain-containing protein n=1 Tax=Peronospora belbahrii TaxID=622444 RepID=A0ABN8CMR2_9STRA|nr:unnamed protein product [Peronospora belbahrii]
MAQNVRLDLAMLRTMFPSWDVEVLEELLLAHQGDVERTVNSMLAMDTMPTASQTQIPEPPSAFAQTLESPTRRQRNAVPFPSVSPRGKPYTCTNLPEDFLRLPVDEFRGLTDQEEHDAVLARMLQDQFFRDEVLSSEEFSSHFQDDRSMRQYQVYTPEKTAAKIANETYAVVSKKFTSLSEVMKSKMNDMYMRFQMRNDAANSTDPKSTRPLMEDDSCSSEDEDEDLNHNSSVRRRNTDHRRIQGSPRRWSPSNMTGKPKTGTGAFSKKND